MEFSIRLALAVIVAFALTASAGLAQTVNFPGWERQYAAAGVQFLSPKDERQLAVAFAMTVAADSAGDPKEEFSGAVADLISGLGAEAETIERSGPADQAGMILEALKLKRNDGVVIDLLLAAYPVADGRWQIAFLMYPSALGDADPRVVQALDVLATAFNAGYALLDPQRFDATAPAAKSLTTVADAPPLADESAQESHSQQCARLPIWGARISAQCVPSGVCNDLVVKEYETVCS